MRALDLALLVVLGAIWGASFLFIRVAAPALGPVPLMCLRVVLAGTALFAWARARGIAPDARRWREFLLLGTLNNAIPFVSIATAELVLTASLGAILNGTSPFFTVIITAVWAGRRPSVAQLVGTIVGFAGVATLVGFGPLEGDGAVFVAIGLSLIGALSYAVAAVYAGRTFRGTSSIEIAIGQLLGSSAVLLPGAVLTRTSSPPDPAVAGSLLALALVGTALAYLIYFGLIARAGPTRAITVTLLIPIFGVLFGHVFLGEPVGPGLVAGLALILVGITLVTGIARPAQSSQNGAT